MKKRVAILISGGGSNMVRLVQSMDAAHAATPCLVLSSDTNAVGLIKARAMGVPTANVDHRPFKGDRHGFEAELMLQLLDSAPDIICLAGFMRVLTAEFVNRWAGRMLNIHPSLLPKYKGLHTHARVLEAGETEHGCTVHQVTAALDDGPLLGQARVPVLPEDTETSLAERVLEAEHQLYPATLRRFADGDRSLLLI
ncbi:MAG: phosphoribosylglycinamide formyltransferase [Paracoccaceae bacterium]